MPSILSRVLTVQGWTCDPGQNSEAKFCPSFFCYVNTVLAHTSFTNYIFVEAFSQIYQKMRQNFPMPQVEEIPSAKAAVQASRFWELYVSQMIALISL